MNEYVSFDDYSRKGGNIQNQHNNKPLIYYHFILYRLKNKKTRLEGISLSRDKIQQV